LSEVRTNVALETVGFARPAVPVGDKGQVVNWIAETSKPLDMIARGRTPTVKAGDEVSVTMIVAKNGVPVGRVRQVVLPNGQTLAATGAVPAALTSCTP